MGSANDIKHRRDILLPRICTDFCHSSVRPITIFCFAFNPSTPARGLGGGDRLTPICFPVRHHGPDDPGHLVSQSNRHELARLALQQFQKPF